MSLVFVLFPPERNQLSVVRVAYAGVKGMSWHFSRGLAKELGYTFVLRRMHLQSISLKMGE